MEITVSSIYAHPTNDSYLITAVANNTDIVKFWVTNRDVYNTMKYCRAEKTKIKITGNVKDHRTEGTKYFDINQTILNRVKIVTN